MAEFEFTPDEEIAAFQAGERNVDLTGFVDWIEGLKTVRTTQGHVYKLILNNDQSTRMRVLIWGTNMARTWDSQIQIHAVVQSIGGTVKTSHASYRDPALHIMKYHVQPSTAVSILGTYMPGNRRPIAAIYKPIEMSQVMFEEGQLEINCYIRTPFRVVQFKRSQCGQGQVTDGYYRLTVNIAAYTSNDNLTTGTAITITILSYVPIIHLPEKKHVEVLTQLLQQGVDLLMISLVYQNVLL